jgi:hypothetical protein
MQLELPLADWRLMSSAPRTSVDVEAWNGMEIRIVHFAEDWSGSEQPPFHGWFYPILRSNGSVSYYTAMYPEPKRWRPLYT